ncbi:MAG: sensor histidine kinase [Nitrospiraceae bacterium]|nr:MAG: sensor histidine kinase [Nitrospiraceae bacterium]
MNLKIWHKMIIGISIPALITLIGGFFTYAYINDVKLRHGFVEIADDLRERVLEVRRNEKNFLLHKTDEYYRYSKDATDTLNKSLNNISPEIVAQAGNDEFLLLRDSLRTYSDLIHALLKNYRQEDLSVEKVREEGRKLEAFVKAENHDRELSPNFVLDLRRLEKNYMLFRDKTSFDRLNDALAGFNNLAPFCLYCVQYTTAINNLISVYNKITGMENDLQGIGNTLEETTDRIARSERQKVNAFFSSTQRLLLIALILLCTFGPLLVYQTASYIVTPIKRLADITRKISQGDMTLRAPIKEHDETYTLAVSFNRMLDHLQLTRSSLEKSLELLHEKHVEVEKRASLGFLVSGVAHELNNPLNNISLTAETMKEDLNELSAEELKEHIQDIISQSERAKHIIEDLLDFAGARKSTAMEKTDIINVLAESINLVANQLKVSHIHLKKDIHKTPVFIRGNQSKLEEIFVNIMVNAIHAMKGSGDLSICAGPDGQGKFITVEISDTGCGIPGKDLKNIFEPFYTTKQSGGGTGLGLAVTHSLVEKHSGDINVRSKVGEGTTFTVRFPLYEETD